ncbi:hypothetical protein QE152_g10917 [Popillia japonica]|uniref:Uncharacterized protein n=1 Tax=Popillia japonica TaxID=7064 RepID=A0AAW1LP37_POPJA
MTDLLLCIFRLIPNKSYEAKNPATRRSRRTSKRRRKSTSESENSEDDQEAKNTTEQVPPNDGNTKSTSDAENNDVVNAKEAEKEETMDKQEKKIKLKRDRDDVDHRRWKKKRIGKMTMTIEKIKVTAQSPQIVNTNLMVDNVVDVAENAEDNKSKENEPIEEDRTADSNTKDVIVTCDENNTVVEENKELTGNDIQANDTATTVVDESVK